MSALSTRYELEEQFAARLGKLSARHRRELEELLGDPPDVRNVPPEFWSKVEREVEDESAAMMALIFLAATEESNILLEPDISKIIADGYASERSRDFASAWVTTSRDRLQAASTEWAERMRQAGTDGATTDGQELITRREVRERTLEIFGPSRVESAVVTETTAAETGGGEAAAEADPRTLVAVWRHGSNRPAGHSRAAVKPCPICSAIEGMTRDEWEAVHPELLGPPAHPHCDCFLDWIDPEELDPIPTGRTFPSISEPVVSRI